MESNRVGTDHILDYVRWYDWHPLLLSNSCVAAKLLVHPQDLIRQVAAFRSMLLLNTASCRV